MVRYIAVTKSGSEGTHTHTHTGIIGFRINKGEENSSDKLKFGCQLRCRSQQSIPTSKSMCENGNKSNLGGGQLRMSLWELVA